MCINTTKIVKATLPLLFSVHLATASFSENTDLYNSVKNGKVEVVRKKLLEGSDPNTIGGSDGMPILSLAVLHCHTDMAKMLIKHGAEVNRTSIHGDSPLLFAVSDGCMESAKLLLKSGATPDLANASGNTALEFAIRGNKNDMAKLLLIYGANPNKLNKRGRTPAMIAVLATNTLCLKHLLLHGADATIKDSQDKTIFDYPSIYKCTKRSMLSFLHVLATEPNFMIRCFQKKLLIDYITMHPKAIYRANADGNTLFHTAAYYGNRSAMCYLLTKAKPSLFTNVDNKTVFDLMKPNVSDLLTIYKPKKKVDAQARIEMLMIAELNDIILDDTSMASAYEVKRQNKKITRINSERSKTGETNSDDPIEIFIKALLSLEGVLYRRMDYEKCFHSRKNTQLLPIKGKLSSNQLFN